MDNTLVDKVDQSDPVEYILKDDILESDRNFQSTDPTTVLSICGMNDPTILCETRDFLHKAIVLLYCAGSNNVISSRWENKCTI
jgi:hypothetical protein